MPRGRKPKAKEQVVETPTPEKKKRGRPKKVEAPPVVEAPKPVVEVKPAISKKVAKVIEQRPEVPLTPEEQRVLDEHNAEFKKKIDAATKDATADNVIQKLFNALGKPAVDW